MKKRFSKKTLIILSSIIILIALLVFLVLWMLSPHSGSVAVSTLPEMPEERSYTTKTLDGTYIRFDYSSRYGAKNEATQGDDLEIHRLNADTHYDKQILASVSKLPGNNIENNSAYLFRSHNADLYTSRQVQTTNATVTVWVRNDGTEQTAIIPHGDKIAIIVLLTGSKNDKLTTEVDTLLATFKWK